MTEINRGIDRVGRRAKLFLSPSQKYKIWLQLIRQEVTIAEAAEQQHVDRSTIMRIHRVSARTGGVDALRQERLHPAVDRHVIHGDARSASNSSTSRSDSPQRRYQRTATAMTSRRKRYPRRSRRCRQSRSDHHASLVTARRLQTQPSLCGFAVLAS